MKINEKNLAAYSVSSSDIHKEGYLLKKGEVNKAFQKRWFVLKGNLLFYFDKKGDKDPLGVIIMEGCTIELAECEDHPCCFRIIFPSREYLIATDNQELMESWMKSLARCSYTYLKLMVAELENQLQELGDSEADSCTPIEATPTSRNPPQRLNPFNTPEENRLLSELWEPTKQPSSSSDSLQQTVLVNSSVEDLQSTGRQRSNTFTCSTVNYTSSDSNGNDIASTKEKMSNSQNGKNKSRTVWHDDSSNINNNLAPVAPKRHKKLSGLRKPPKQQNISKFDSLSSGSSSSDSYSSYFYQHPTKRPFTQLHMDYGALILKDRDLYWLMMKETKCRSEMNTTSEEIIVCVDKSNSIAGDIM